MMRPRDVIGWVAAAMLALGPTTVSAATPAQTCEAGKNRSAGKYADCRHKAKASFAGYGWTAAFTKVASLNATSFAGYTDWRCRTRSSCGF